MLTICPGLKFQRYSGQTALRRSFTVPRHFGSTRNVSILDDFEERHVRILHTVGINLNLRHPGTRRLRNNDNNNNTTHWNSQTRAFWVKLPCSLFDELESSGL